MVLWNYCENIISGLNFDSTTNALASLVQLCDVSTSSSTTESSSENIGMGLALSNLVNFNQSFSDYLQTNWLLLLFILATIILIILAIIMLVKSKSNTKSTTPTPTK